MGIRGQRPTPLALRIAAGNPQRRPIPNVPAPEPSAPRCPAHLQGEARREWHRLVKELQADGLMTKRDRAVFAVYCMAWGRWLQAEEKLWETGGMVIEGDKGLPVRNPYLSVSKNAMDQVMKAGAEFGLSPVSRMRVRVDPGHKKTSKASRYIE